MSLYIDLYIIFIFLYSFHLSISFNQSRYDGWTDHGEMDKAMSKNDLVKKEKQEEPMLNKCISLLDLWRTKITLSEFKILELYLSKIDCNDPKTRFVTFSKKEIESLLGIKINAEDLRIRLNHLLHNVVALPTYDKNKSFKFVTLFEIASYEESEEKRKPIELGCTESAMKFFFNYQEIGYLRYGLNSVIRLKSRYAYIMFMYLERNRLIQNVWEESIDGLKGILNCEEVAVCAEYRRFNEKVLKRVHKEITERTSCKYTYTPVKQGTKVVGIRFELEDLPEARTYGNSSNVICGMIKSDIVDQVFDDVISVDAVTKNADSLNILTEKDICPAYMDSVRDFGMSKEDFMELEALLKLMPLDKAFWADETISDEENFKKYLTLKARTIYSKGEKVKNKGRYLIKMVKTELEGFNNNKEPPKTSAEKYLSRYSQREYSKEEMEEIEMRMLEKSLGCSLPRADKGDLKG